MTVPSFPPEFPEPPRRIEPRGEPSPPAWFVSPEVDRLLERRIVLAHGHLDGERASELSGRLIMLAGSGDEPVALHLRTPDGDLTAAFALADTIGMLGCPVHALVAGQVGGPPLAVLAAASRREMMRHATLLLTEPHLRYEGRASDVATREQEQRHLVDALYIRLAEVTGREVDEIREDARGGRLLTAEEAVAYGLVHSIA